MLDLYFLAYGVSFLVFFFVAKDRLHALNTTLRAAVFVLAASFLCGLTSLLNYSLVLDGVGAWSQWASAASPTVYSVRALCVSNWPELLQLQNAVLLSGAFTSGVFVILLASKPLTILRSALFSAISLAAIAFVFVTTDSLPVLFVGFELLLLLSLFLLRLTSKSERVVDASVEMFFWTLFGSAALLVVFAWCFVQGHLTFQTLNACGQPSALITFLVIVGFGVKIPLWPFFSWLLKAHVEASVEFSILLSGFIVKLGVYGLYKTLLAFSATWAPHLLFAFSLLGLTAASMRLFSQRDLKRVVALTTVVEMNWLGLCLALGGHTFNGLAAYIVAVHSITTALEFLLVETLSKRYGSRDLGAISGIFAATPFLGAASFFIILSTIGFPGTPLFTAKLLFFAELSSVSWGLCVVLGLLLLLVVPLFFVRLWAPLWFGLGRPSASTYDLNSAELLIFFSLLVAATLLAVCPQLLLAW